VPRKMRGTLSWKISNFAYILIFTIFLYMLYFVAIWEYSKPLLLEFYIYIAILASDLQTVSIYNVIKFLYNSSTIKLLLLLIVINGYI
jgi:hypothetical protein